jgi:hypothetical protein
VLQFATAVARRRSAEVLLERERYELSARSGGGILSYEVWGMVKAGRTVVTRYNLAYINPLVFSGDHGRLLGYDNAHGEHHRHFIGKTEAVDIGSYEEALDRFQAEWQELVKTLKRPKASKPRRGKRS